MSTTNAPKRKLQRNAGLIGLIFASTTTMIGSGWLFGPLHAAKLAGPWSIASWVFGALIALVIAPCFAELGTMFPRSGGLVHMSYASHGAGLGRIWGWMLFIAYVPIPAVEAEAILTYANNYFPFLIQNDSNGALSAIGFIVAVGLLLWLALLNLMSIRWLMHFNTTVTWWKLIVPLGTVFALFWAASNIGNFHAAPKSYDYTGIFTAIPSAGIVFSFLGFRTAIDLAGESKRPSRNLPIALVGSLLLTAAVYISLQVAFILAIPASSLADGGWSQLSFQNSTGPFAALATLYGMTSLAALIYLDAYVSPAGTGFIMITCSNRLLLANGELGAGPRWLTKLSKFNVPWINTFVTWAAGCIFLFPFPAWQQLVGYISATTTLTYGLVPVALLTLRQNAPHAERPFQVRPAWLVASLSFIFCNWIVFWTGYYTNTFLFALLATVFVIYVIYYYVIARLPRNEFGWRNISWLLPWFSGMWIISKFSTNGGLGYLSFTESLIIIAVWSLIVIKIAFYCSLTHKQTYNAIKTILNQDDSVQK